MAVFRVEKTKDYTIMSNHHLKDRRLSLKAKGLLSMMLSLPKEWDYTSCATNRFFLFMSVQKLNNHKRVMVSHNTLAEASCESKYSFGFFLIPIFPESQLH